jgi:hypothetical protein
MQPWDVEMQRRTTAFANAILDEEQARAAKLRAALDAVQGRFGPGAVRRGSELDAGDPEQT